MVFSSSSSAPLIPDREKREVPQHQLLCSFLSGLHDRCGRSNMDIAISGKIIFPRTGRPHVGECYLTKHT